MVTDHLQSVIERAMLTVPEGVHVHSIMLFGSRLSGEEHPGSDYDFVADIDDRIGMFGLLAIKHALEDSLGARVDLLMTESVHPVLKKQILSTARTVYEKR